jgi:hypothetical protein
MKSRIYLIAFFFLSGLSLSAQDLVNVDKESAKSEAMKNIRVEKDDFSHVAKYFSDRTPKDIKDLNRFFIFISVPENQNQQRLFLEVSHYASFHPVKGYMRYRKIVLLADDKTIELPLNQGTIRGNGTRHSTFTMGFGRKPEFYEFIKSTINAQVTKARLFTDDNRYLDFEISSRERKALNDVITLWELISKN